jgi:hypothetical protein
MTLRRTPLDLCTLLCSWAYSLRVYSLSMGASEARLLGVCPSGSCRSSRWSLVMVERGVYVVRTPCKHAWCGPWRSVLRCCSNGCREDRSAPRARAPALWGPTHPLARECARRCELWLSCELPALSRSGSATMRRAHLSLPIPTRRSPRGRPHTHGNTRRDHRIHPALGGRSGE